MAISVDFVEMPRLASLLLLTWYGYIIDWDSKLTFTSVVCVVARIWT